MAIAGKLHPKLLQWFRSNSRKLPWRAAKAGAYERWLSEIMLQQTRVETVLPYYQKFLKRFPKISDLAAADIDEVQNMWAGLGYYSRARNLHRCAVEIVETHNGRFPKTREALKELPGIGPYTSAAIASMAFDEKVAAIDGNLERVLARVLGLEEIAKGHPKIESLAEQIVQLGEAGKINEALMDLSATICKVKNPDCLLCPLSGACRTQKSGRFTEIPKKAPKKPKVELYSEGFAIFRRDELGWSVLAARRPKGAWLSGMWDIPWRLVDSQDAPLNIPGKTIGVPAAIKRTITHHKIHLSVKAKLAKEQNAGAYAKALRGLGSEFRWLSWDDAQASLPRPSRKALLELAEQLPD